MRDDRANHLRAATGCSNLVKWAKSPQATLQVEACFLLLWGRCGGGSVDREMFSCGGCTGYQLGDGAAETNEHKAQPDRPQAVSGACLQGLYLDVPKDDWGTSSRRRQALGQNSTACYEPHTAHRQSLLPEVSPSLRIEEIPRMFTLGQSER